LPIRFYVPIVNMVPVETMVTKVNAEDKTANDCCTRNANFYAVKS
jgi:hypothetical protein